MNNEHSKQLYAICKHKETEEYHVFLTHSNNENKCYFSSNVSICGAMNSKDKDICIIACATENEIRNRSAELGDKVCGNCMKSIYKTKD